MSARVKIMTGAAGLAAAVGLATPAAAQYYPGQGYGYGYGYNQNPIGQIVNSILGYGRYPYGNYGYNQYGNHSYAIDRCARAVEARISGRGYGDFYGGYGGYGYDRGYGGGRVQGITRVEPKRYGLKVWGVASSGYDRYDGYRRRGYGNYGYNAGADLRWDCEVDYRGRIRDIDIDRRSAYWRGY